MDLTGRDVCVLELEHSGHRLFFAVLLANHLADQGARTSLVTSPEAIASPQGREHLRFLNQRVEIADCAKSKGLNYWVGHFCQTADKVIVLDGEGLVYQAKLPKVDPNKVVALMLHSPELYRIRPALNRLAKRALIRRARAKGYTLINLASPGIVVEGRPGIAPDPSPFALIHDLTLPERAVPLSQELTWIGVFGGISARKGPELALDAIALSGRTDLGLLVVGKWQDHDLLARFRKKSNLIPVEVVLVDSYVSTEDLRCYIASVDVVLVLNQNEGSSGILLAACTLNKPVFTSGSSSLRHDAKVLQVPWVRNDPEALGQALESFTPRVAVKASCNMKPDGSDFTHSIIRLICSTQFNL